VAEEPDHHDRTQPGLPRQRTGRYSEYGYRFLPTRSAILVCDRTVVVGDLLDGQESLYVLSSVVGGGRIVRSSGHLGSLLSVVAGGAALLEVESALRSTFRRLSLDRCGPQVVANDCEQFGLHRRGDGHELLPGGTDEFAVVVIEPGDVDALEVETPGDTVLDEVADPFVDARADTLEPPGLWWIGERVLVELLHAYGGDRALARAGLRVRTMRPPDAREASR
jgi:hypothetical protein